MRNVILLTADSLRADHLSCYGYRRRTTPNLDALASRGALFRHAFSHGASTPFSFPALIGGVYPMAIDRWTDHTPHFPVLSPYFPHLAEAFRDGGYVTGGFHSNPYLSRFYGYARGFDTFYDSIPKGGDSGSRWHRRGMRRRMERMIRRSRVLYSLILSARDLVFPMTAPYVSAADVHERALCFIDSSPEPFFLWVHYMDTHNPFVPDQEDFEAFIGRPIAWREIARINRPFSHKWADRVDIRGVIDLYDTTIWRLDREIGTFIDGLEERGLLDDSIIVFTADHGETFLEHDGIAHPHDHLYDEQVHVPLIMSGVDAGADDALVGHIDIGPTLLRAVGLEVPEGHMGMPLPHDRKEVYAGVHHRDRRRVAVRTRRWKYIWDLSSDRAELYDLENDPGELRDLSSERPGGAQAMRELLELHLATVERQVIGMRIRSSGLRKGD